MHENQPIELEVLPVKTSRLPLTSPEEEQSNNQKSIIEFGSDQNLNLSIQKSLNENKLSVGDVAEKINNSVFHYEKVRKLLEDKNIGEDWIIDNLIEIAKTATKPDSDGMMVPDYKTRLAAIKEISSMAKMNGDMGSIASTAKNLLVAQGAKSGEGTVINFTKLLYGNNQ